MYNRYIGNTGKVYRVSEERGEQRSGSVDHHGKREEAPPVVEPIQAPVKKKGAIKLSALFSGGGKLLDNVLPFGLETGDLIILALFLFLYLESGDEEFLIILGFLAYSIFKENRGL